ncbi:MAG TPA: hypothetical protein VH518_22905, partial [Tepidisphaeraceae bacterium]
MISERRHHIPARALSFLLAGAAVSIVVAWALWATLDPRLVPSQSIEGFEGSTRWLLTTYRRPGVLRIDSLRQIGGDWAPEQALGPPDTPQAGDSRLAWCPATADGQREWLILQYPDAIVPRSVEVYANMGPGAVDRISAFDKAGDEVEAWHGSDPIPATQPSGVSRIPINIAFKTKRIKIELNSPGVVGWNEIDAVGLVDDHGNTWWAQSVSASSMYGRPPTQANNMAEMSSMAPSWSRLRVPSSEFIEGRVRQEQRSATASGWPMMAMWGPGIFPLYPIWTGLLIDTVVLAILLGAVWWLLVQPRRFVTELTRMRRGCCLNCGYDLRYDFARGCPECG